MRLTRKDILWLLSIVLFAMTTLMLPTIASAQKNQNNSQAVSAEAGAVNDKTQMTQESPETQKVDSPYGLEAVWRGSDLVAKLTLVILMVMSIGSWYILFSKFYEQKKLMDEAKTALPKFWAAASIREGLSELNHQIGLYQLVEAGLLAQEHYQSKDSQKPNEESLHWIGLHIHQATESVQSRLQENLAFLATVGSTAPFVGLFGTVWGIYHALTAIGVAGQASIDKVAGPVGEALIMTAIGLAVAVPAVLGYNWLVRRNKKAMEYIRTTSARVTLVLQTGLWRPVH